tara:strand:- start:1 stop:429 length:429 start_codon:yes stop_codon:yes gene_type:complete
MDKEIQSRITKLAEEYITTVSHTVSSAKVAAVAIKDGPDQVGEKVVKTLKEQLGCKVGRKGWVTTTVTSSSWPFITDTEFQVSVYCFSKKDLEKFVNNVITAITVPPKPTADDEDVNAALKAATHEFDKIWQESTTTEDNHD